MAIIEAFPGQGTKAYPNSPNPELALFDDAMARHHQLASLLDPELEIEACTYTSFGLFMAMAAMGVTDHSTARQLIPIRSAIVDKDERLRSLNNLGRTGMAVLIGYDASFIEDLIRANQTQQIYHTNDNGISQVIAANCSYLVDLATQLGPRRLIVLPVNGAYHCEVRDHASQEFAEVLEDFPFCDPYLPIISSTAPRVMRTGTEVKNELIDQMRRKVEIPKVAQILEEEGVSHIIDVGPGRFWQSVAGRLLPHVDVFSLESHLDEFHIYHQARKVLDRFLEHTPA